MGHWLAIMVAPNWYRSSITPQPQLEESVITRLLWRGEGQQIKLDVEIGWQKDQMKLLVNGSPTQLNQESLRRALLNALWFSFEGKDED